MTDDTASYGDFELCSGCGRPTSIENEGTCSKCRAEEKREEEETEEEE